MGAPAVQSRPLFDRDSERARLVRALGEARRGRPSLLLVEGPPGAGKTSLLDEACAAARDADVRLLHARGSEFEREFPFGMVRQLFEAVNAQSCSPVPPSWPGPCSRAARSRSRP
jgi:predicted ATPase